MSALGAAVAALLAVVGIYAVVYLPWRAAACSAQAEKMGFEHSFSPLQDCMVRVNGRWIFIDAVWETGQ